MTLRELSREELLDRMAMECQRIRARHAAEALGRAFQRMLAEIAEPFFQAMDRLHYALGRLERALGDPRRIAQARYLRRRERARRLPRSGGGLAHRRRPGGRP